MKTSTERIRRIRRVWKDVKAAVELMRLDIKGIIPVGNDAERRALFENTYDPQSRSLYVNSGVYRPTLSRADVDRILVNLSTLLRNVSEFEYVLDEEARRSQAAAKSSTDEERIAALETQVASLTNWLSENKTASNQLVEAANNHHDEAKQSKALLHEATGLIQQSYDLLSRLWPEWETPTLLLELWSFEKKVQEQVEPVSVDGIQSAAVPWRE